MRDALTVLSESAESPLPDMMMTPSTMLPEARRDAGAPSLTDAEAPREMDPGHGGGAGMLDASAMLGVDAGVLADAGATTNGGNSGYEDAGPIGNTDAGPVGYGIVDAGSADPWFTFPTYAGCIALNDPDPEYCANQQPFGQFTVDTYDHATGSEAFVLLHFEVPVGEPAPNSIALVMFTTNANGADSNQSGEVWQLEPFTDQSLGLELPERVGASPLSPDRGPVARNATVEWVLPLAVLDGSGAVYLGVFATTNDGVDYYSHQGALPPRLVLSY
jgi:hypothetical protein